MTDESDVIAPCRAAAGVAACDVARRRVAMRAAVLLLAGAFSLPAWALHWPWTHRSAAPRSAAVHVLSISLGGAAATATGASASAGAATAHTITQYWDRNTLLLDLTYLGGSGSATLMPVPANGGWPVRLEFRVRCGTIARLEVLADQRVVFTVPAQGGAVLLRLDPGVYQPDSARISLRWSSVDELPH